MDLMGLVSLSYQCLLVVLEAHFGLVVLEFLEVLRHLSVLMNPVDQRNLSLLEVLLVQSDPVSPAGLEFQRPRPDPCLLEAQLDQRHLAGLLGLVDQGFLLLLVIPGLLSRLENQENQMYLE